MVAILLAGAIAYYQLLVSALPQVDYPTIQVLTFYPGTRACYALYIDAATLAVWNAKHILLM